MVDELASSALYWASMINLLYTWRIPLAFVSCQDLQAEHMNMRIIERI